MDLEKLLPLLLFAGWSIISVIAGNKKNQKTSTDNNDSHEETNNPTNINIFENLKQYAQQFGESFTQEAIVELPKEEKENIKILTKIESAELNKNLEQKTNLKSTPLVIQKEIKKRKINIISSKKDLSKAVILSEIISAPVSLRTSL